MKYRLLGKTGFKVSEISLGTWQVGGKWGEQFDNQSADALLNGAIDAGINFIDTADVYENGQSETAVGRVVRARKEEVHVASKCGRFINPHVNEGYLPKVLKQYVDDTLKRTGLETIDLIQLHCPPNDVYYRPEIFELFDRLKEQGKIQFLGVSVEKVEQALKAIEYENVATVQIIFNVFRQRPAELFFNEAKNKNIGVIARVPLASGLLTGKFNQQTVFDSQDHRNFNRNGEVFDKGETFSGIDYATGLEAVQVLKSAFTNEKELATLALRWILSFKEVSCVIPGASKLAHLEGNLAVQNLAPLKTAEIEKMNKIYQEKIKHLVHHLW